MHEMTIVSGVLKIAEDQARAAEATVINSIELEVGQLAGIELDSLHFCFGVACKNTMAAGAELVVHSIAGKGYCSECAKEVLVGIQMGVCPECEKAILEISQGRELRVLRINVD